MGPLQRAVASLRIAGPDLVPEEITSLLGATPSREETKGQVLTNSLGRSRTARIGVWSVDASDTKPEDLDRQVAELLGRLNADLSVWKDISTRFEVEFFCGWFMGSSNEGVSIAPATLLALGERGIELVLDLYGPETEA